MVAGLARARGGSFSMYHVASMLLLKNTCMPHDNFVPSINLRDDLQADMVNILAHIGKFVRYIALNSRRRSHMLRFAIRLAFPLNNDASRLDSITTLFWTVKLILRETRTNNLHLASERLARPQLDTAWDSTQFSLKLPKCVPQFCWTVVWQVSQYPRTSTRSYC